MADITVAFREFLRKQQLDLAPDILRPGIQVLTQALMEAEVRTQIRAAPRASGRRWWCAPEVMTAYTPATRMGATNTQFDTGEPWCIERMQARFGGGPGEKGSASSTSPVAYPTTTCRKRCPIISA